MADNEAGFLEDFREGLDFEVKSHEVKSTSGIERGKHAKFYFILQDQGSGFRNEELKQKALKAIDAARNEKNPLFDYLISYGGDLKNNLGINLEFTKNIPGQEQKIMDFLSSRDIITGRVYPVIDDQPVSETETPLAA
jgi:hypothetical protein